MERQDELHQLYILDTLSLLSAYDGRHTVEGLKDLIDETRVRLAKLYRGEVKESDVAV